MQSLHTLFGCYTIATQIRHNLPSLPGSGYQNNLAQLGHVVNYLDVEYTLAVAKHVLAEDPGDYPEISEAYICLVALMERYQALQQSQSKMWVMASYRIGDQTCLVNDIWVWHHKLFVRLQLRVK
jgi:hypothetical protein